MISTAAEARGKVNQVLSNRNIVPPPVTDYRRVEQVVPGYWVLELDPNNPASLEGCYFIVQPNRSLRSYQPAQRDEFEAAVEQVTAKAQVT
jgi:hypothetical protein